MEILPCFNSVWRRRLKSSTLPSAVNPAGSQNLISKVNVQNNTGGPSRVLVNLQHKLTDFFKHIDTRMWRESPNISIYMVPPPMSSSLVLIGIYSVYAYVWVKKSNKKHRISQFKNNHKRKETQEHISPILSIWCLVLPLQTFAFRKFMNVPSTLYSAQNSEIAFANERGFKI